MMIPELVAKLRGLDKWPTATATVTESELVTTPESGEWNNFSFYYRPSGSEIQSGNLKADSLTSIYSLRVGDSFEIPSRFSSKEVHSFTRTFGTIMTPAVILFVIALVVSEILGALKHEVTTQAGCILLSGDVLARIGDFRKCSSPEESVMACLAEKV